MKRIAYLVFSVVVMLLAGFVYAWSILVGPIAAEFPAWTSAQLALTFTLCMSFFCIGGTCAGVLSKRVSPRWNLLVAAVLFALGFWLTAQAQALMTLYLGFGVLGGTACGFTYNAILNMVPRWFPEGQATVSGVLLMAFGASSLIIGSAYSSFTATGSWREFMTAMGIILPVLAVIGALVLRSPESNGQGSVAIQRGQDFSTGEMLKTPNFWVIFLWTLLLGGAGLMIISQAGDFVKLVGPELSGAEVSLMVGISSVCNGLGRVIYGALFDQKGQKLTTAVISGVYLVGCGVLAAALKLGSVGLLAAAFAVVGISYGGSPSMSAALTKSFFGQRDYATNFALMNFNLLIASCFSTISGAIYDACGSYAPVVGLTAGLVAGSLAVQFFVQKPEKYIK